MRKLSMTYDGFLACKCIKDLDIILVYTYKKEPTNKHN